MFGCRGCTLISTCAIRNFNLKHVNFARTYQLSMHCKQMHKICLASSTSVNLYLPNISGFKYVNYVNSISKRVRLRMITSQKCFCAKFSAHTCTDEAKVKQKQSDEKLPHISNPICSVSYFTPCMINNSVFLQTYYNSKYLQSNSVSTKVFEDVSLRRTRKIVSPNFGLSEMASSSYRKTNARLYRSGMDLSGNEFYPHRVSSIVDGLHWFFNTVPIEKTLFLNSLLHEKNYWSPQCSFAECSQSWNRGINIKMPTTVDNSDFFISNSGIIKKVPYELLKNILSYTKYKREKELCKKMAFKRTFENISSISIDHSLGIRQKNVSYIFSTDSLCAEINMYEYPILKNCIQCKEAVLLSKSFNSYLSAAKGYDQIGSLDCFTVNGSSVKTINLIGNYQKLRNNLKKCNKLYGLCSGKNVHKKDYGQKTFKRNTYKNSKRGIMVGLLAGCCFSKESSGKEENSKLSKTMETSEVEDLYVEGETGVGTQKENNEIFCEDRTSQSAWEIINGSFTPEIKSEGIASTSRSVVRENSEEVIYSIQSKDSRNENQNMFLQMSLPSTSFCSTGMFESARVKIKRTSSLVDEPSSKLMKFDRNGEKNELSSQSEAEVRQTKTDNVGLYLTEKCKQVKSLQENSQLKATVTPRARQAEADNDTESPDELLLAVNNKCSDGGCKRLKLSEDCFELKIDETNEPCNSSTADNDEGSYNISSLFSEEQLQSNYGKEKSFPRKETDEGKSKKDSKTKPNYFVAIRVDNQEIYKALENIQNHITTKDKRLKPAMISLNTLHITLMVMHISDPEELQRAIEALKVAYNWINAIISNSSLHLQFQGLDHFGNKVLFAKLKPGSALDFLSDIAKKVLESFETAGISSTDSRSFNPHLTILKLSKSPALYKKGIKKIAPSLYLDYKDDLFGVQTAKSIQLLSMYKPKDPTGYFFCSKELTFDTPIKSLNASTMVANPEEKKRVRNTVSSLVEAQLKKQSKSD